jgi:RsiW-degrading membrane proteinase PrsW (M82 family)
MFSQDKMQVRGLKYFSRSPWRTFFFLGNTFLLLVVTLVPITIIWDSGSAANRWKAISMFAPIVLLVTLWVRMWKAHSDVYEAIRSTSTDRHAEFVDIDPKVEIPLDALAYMLYRGFGLALFAVMLAYAATDDFVRALLHR